MVIVNIHEAKTQISKLVERAVKGEPFGMAKDPFDRLLLAQALGEGITLVTGDVQFLRYGGPVRRM